MELLQIFKRFSGETLFLSSVLPLNPSFNLAFAAKMHGCQGKNAAKEQEILPFTMVFNRFKGKNLLLWRKNLLQIVKKMV